MDACHEGSANASAPQRQDAITHAATVGVVAGGIGVLGGAWMAGALAAVQNGLAAPAGRGHPS
jgi:hypothetical protein